MKICDFACENYTENARKYRRWRRVLCLIVWTIAMCRERGSVDVCSFIFHRHHVQMNEEGANRNEQREKRK